MQSEVNMNCNICEGRIDKSDISQAFGEFVFMPKGEAKKIKYELCEECARSVYAVCFDLKIKKIENKEVSV